MNSIKVISENIKLKKLKNLKNPLINFRKIADPLVNFRSLKGNKEISYDNSLKFKRFSIYDSYDPSMNQTVRLRNSKLSDISSNKIESNLNQDLSGISLLNHSNSTFGEKNIFIRNRLTSFKIRMIGSFKNKIDNLTQQNSLSSVLKSGFDSNHDEINKKNLSNLKKIWEEFNINEQYRKYFTYIYNELDDDYKQQLYQKEKEELNNVKTCIKDLKYFINLREKELSNIKILNDNLGKELLNKNYNEKEMILNEISDKFISLREHTVKICKSMKKLKDYIFSINHLGKYNFDEISKKFDFDKNYIIKMKSELNFLREGFTKYYFNIENDQSPFLLNASNKSKIPENDFFLRIIPLNEKLKEEILECNFYIYQELIAYQNENIDKKDFRCISPIKIDEAFNEQKNNLYENRKDEEKNNSNKDKIENDSMSFLFDLKKYKAIDIYMEENKKKRRALEKNVKKNLSHNYSFTKGEIKNILEKDNNPIKKINKTNKTINQLEKNEINKNKLKKEENKKDENLNKTTDILKK